MLATGHSVGVSGTSRIETPLTGVPSCVIVIAAGCKEGIPGGRLDGAQPLVNRARKKTEKHDSVMRYSAEFIALFIDYAEIGEKRLSVSRRTCAAAHFATVQPTRLR